MIVARRPLRSCWSGFPSLPSATSARIRTSRPSEAAGAATTTACRRSAFALASTLGCLARWRRWSGTGAGIGYTPAKINRPARRRSCVASPTECRQPSRWWMDFSGHGSPFPRAPESGGPQSASAGPRLPAYCPRAWV